MPQKPLTPLQRTGKPNYPYYSLTYAESLKPIIERMLTTGDAVKLDAKRIGKCVASLEKYCSRASLFLIDHCDTPDKRYARWRSAVVFKRNFDNDCIYIRFKMFTTKQIEPVSGVVIKRIENERTDPYIQSLIWRKPLNEFLEKCEEGDFQLTGLHLTEEDIEGIKLSVMGFPGLVIHQLDCTTINLGIS